MHAVTMYNTYHITYRCFFSYMNYEENYKYY